MKDAKHASHAPMNTSICFTEEKSGYNREQVDDYVNKLSQEYQTAYNERQSVVKKYNDLLEDCKNLDVQQQTVLNSDIVAKTLTHTELLAQNIIADAHNEAAAVRAAAKAEINSIINKLKSLAAANKSVSAV